MRDGTDERNTLARATLLAAVCIGLVGGAPEWFIHHEGAANQKTTAPATRTAVK